jgi:hypothetical protein
MKIAGFLFSILIFGMLFELVASFDDQIGRVDLFFFYEHQMWPSSYAYYAEGHFNQIAFALLIHYLVAFIPRFYIAHPFTLAFIVIESLDFLDFWATGNTKWFDFHEWPITFNVVKVFIFVAVSAYEYLGHHITSHSAA